MLRLIGARIHGAGSCNARAATESSSAPLVSVTNVTKEMGRIYRELRRGELEPDVATKLVYILNSIRTALETADHDRRLAVLEANLP